MPKLNIAFDGKSPMNSKTLYMKIKKFSHEGISI